MQRSAGVRDDWVPKLIDGSVLGALAWQERHGHHELADVQTTLRSAGDGFVLDGDKVLVFNGAAADQLIVSARSAGGRFDEAGISLVRIDAAAPGVQAHAAAADGRPVGGPGALRQVPVSASQLLFAPGEGHAPLRDTVRRGHRWRCAPKPSASCRCCRPRRWTT